MKTKFQSIEMLPVAEGRVHEMLTAAENQLEHLEAMKHQPHALEIATIERLIETYKTQSDYLPFLKAQELQWRQVDDLTDRQHDMLASLAHALTLTEKVIQTILEFLHATVDSLIVEENKTWMETILAGNANVPVLFKEELATLKASARSLTLFQQATLVTIHEHMRSLQSEGATQEDCLHKLRDFFPTMKALLHLEKHDALIYYCCLYPGLNEAMRLFDQHETEKVIATGSVVYN